MVSHSFLASRQKSIHPCTPSSDPSSHDLESRMGLWRDSLKIVFAVATQLDLSPGSEVPTGGQPRAEVQHGQRYSSRKCCRDSARGEQY